MCVVFVRGDNLIFDSDVLIWAFRGKESASNLLLSAESISISAVTYMEFMPGALNKMELFQIKKFLNVFNVKILDITPEITHLAMLYVESYALSNSMQLADALIAATSITNNETLCTANGKHYKCVPDLQMVLFKVE